MAKRNSQSSRHVVAMNGPTDTDALPLRWRERAEDLRPYAPGAAEAFGRAADELELVLQLAASRHVNLTEAARISGYSARALHNMMKDGRLKNVGRSNAPKLRVGDLPSKPPQGVDQGPRLNAIARKALRSKRGGR